MPNDRRVVVTGLGAVSSIGIGWEEFWKNLVIGKSGIGKISAFATERYDRHLGGEVKQFDSSKFINKHEIEKIGRTSQMAIAASKLATDDAKFIIRKKRANKVSLCVGTTGGERIMVESVHKSFLPDGNTQSSRSNVIFCSTESLIANIVSQFRLRGYISVLSTACSSGNYAIGHGYDLIRSGKSDFALVGGADSFAQMVYTGFSRLFAVAPEKCQPFDKDRKGMIPAEGAGFLFLETLESAISRKVTPYAEVLGYGLSCDANHITSPSPNGISKCILKALADAKIKPSDVDYINAHGTGTMENDYAESMALNTVFGKFATKIPTTSIKSMLGHAMGAAAALEAISCVLTLRDGIIPPTINVDCQDERCQINLVKNNALHAGVNIALNNALAFGGNNACVIFRKL